MSSILDLPIYMQYFDRELRNSVSATFNDEYINDLTEVAFLLTSNYLYVANSLLWESRDDFSNSVKFVLELEKCQEVMLLSNYNTLDQFVVSRRQLYVNEKEKYPMYFSDGLNDKPWGKHITILNDSTTKLLENRMKGFSDGENGEELISLCKSIQLSSEVIEIIGKTLENRDGRAITFSLFQQYINKTGYKKIEIESMIKRMISYLYTKRYINVLSGTIMTGIEGLQFFDSLYEKSVFFDYNIHKLIFQSIGILNKSNVTLEQKVMNIINMKRSPEFREFLIELRGFVEGMCSNINISPLEITTDVQKRRLYNEIRKVLTNNTINNPILVGFHSAYFRLLSINSKLSINDLSFRKGYDNMRKFTGRKKILIVTATLTELGVLLSVALDKGIEHSRFVNGNYTYYTLGQLGKNDVYVFKTEMGSVGSTGSILAIKEAVNTLDPDYVIMAGIAFGLKKGKQNLGDILVSRQIWSYEQAKIKNTETLYRGDKITASGLLIDRFSSSSLMWKKTKVEFGLIVSGEKLVNSKEFIKELLDAQPEAIGGEMEGTGLISVCQNVGKEWILIKSICDWGYKKSSDYQDIAAKNVMEYVVDTICNYFD